MANVIEKRLYFNIESTKVDVCISNIAGRWIFCYVTCILGKQGNIYIVSIIGI
jgi:hypothetical protein